MNDTTTTAGNASAAASTSSALDAASLFTTVHLVWLAVFAVLIVLGILYGARLKRRRVRAERQVTEHAREAGVEAAPAVDEETRPAVEGRPTTAAAPSAPAPPSGGEAADGPLSQLKGLGPKVAARLAELGITTVGQIAALDDDAARALDDRLGPFRGRMARDRWVEQARFLAAGDRVGFEAVFGKL